MWPVTCAECLEPVGSDPSIQAGSAIGDRRVGAARSTNAVYLAVFGPKGEHAWVLDG